MRRFVRTILVALATLLVACGATTSSTRASEPFEQKIGCYGEIMAGPEISARSDGHLYYGILYAVRGSGNKITVKELITGYTDGGIETALPDLPKEGEQLCLKQLGENHFEVVASQ
jgi:hypothetical protein